MIKIGLIILLLVWLCFKLDSRKGDISYEDTTMGLLWGGVGLVVLFIGVKELIWKIFLAL